MIMGRVVNGEVADADNTVLHDKYRQRQLQTAVHSAEPEVKSPV